MPACRLDGVAQGPAHVDRLVALVEDPKSSIPESARGILQVLIRTLNALEEQLKELDGEIARRAKADPVARRLMTIPGIGPIAATALAATVGNPRSFTSGRHFAAWIGLVPKQHSSGGKERLGGISKRGDAYLRKLLIHGARAAVQQVRSHQVPGVWIAGLLARRPFNVATVALANKTARIAWAVMTNGSTYRAAA